MFMSELEVGQSGIINELKSKDIIRRRLIDIGLMRNTTVKCIGKSPFGDPKAFLIRGAVIALRQEDCRNIILEDAAEVREAVPNGSY